MIEPTVGRQVWFYPSDAENRAFRISNHQPCAATVIYVHDVHKVNLNVMTHMGDVVFREHVRLIQGEDEPLGLQYAMWMPYQKGQAAKALAPDPDAKVLAGS